MFVFSFIFYVVVGGGGGALLLEALWLTISHVREITMNFKCYGDFKFKTRPLYLACAALGWHVGIFFFFCLTSSVSAFGLVSCSSILFSVESKEKSYIFPTLYICSLAYPFSLSLRVFEWVLRILKGNGLSSR